MDINLSNSIKKALALEAVRKELYTYFEINNIPLDTIVYPPLIRDLQTVLPILGNKIEIKPHIEDVDPTTNYVKIGWNLFVLGTNRMFLGHSVHESIANIDTQINNPLFNEKLIYY